MKRFLLLPAASFSLVHLALSSSACADDLEIARDGASRYEIVVAANASQAAREGAAELRRLMRVVAGVELSVAADATEGRRQIVVGAHPRAAAAGVSAAGLKADGFRMRAVEGNVYLLGEDRDLGHFFWINNNESSHGGSYFAVIEFAERFLGARWYFPGPLGEEAPPRARIAVPSDLDVTQEPRFAHRYLDVVTSKTHESLKKLQTQGVVDGDYFDAASAAEATRWGRRLRLGNNSNLNVQHSWYWWVPAEKPNSWTPRAYGKEHPEYFALRNGQRAARYRGAGGAHGGQLCVSNPDVARTYAENVIAYAKRTKTRSFSLSANDGGEHCECAHCRAWDLEKDGNGEPILTDRLMRFANAVAERVTAAVPDATFGVYAYHETRAPPRTIRLHPAITVSDVYNYLPSLFVHPASRTLMEADLRGWRTQSEKVVLTSYYLGEGFWSLPWSTLEIQGWLMNLLREYPSSLGVRMNYVGSGDLPPMGMLGADPWVLSRLLWNPNQSVEALAREYYLGAFGPAAGPLLQEYFETSGRALAREAAKRPLEGRHAGSSVFGAPMIEAAYSSVREPCASLIRRATAAVSEREERYRWRVDRVARGWRFVELTLDAIEAARTAGKTTGSGRKDAWEKAIRLGQERRALAASPESRFALAPYSMDLMDKAVPLGLVTEMPTGGELLLRAPRMDAAPVVDGRLDEPVWNRAAESSSFRENARGGAAAVKTQVKIFACAEGLAVAFECEEPRMHALKAAKDAATLWSGDVVEIFLVTGGGMDSFSQFAVNPDGLARAVAHRGDRGADLDWKPAWKYAARKSTDGWCAEILIAWKSLGCDGPPPGETVWPADFFRERYTDAQELSGWSPTGGPFALPFRFGRLQFSPQNQLP